MVKAGVPLPEGLKTTTDSTSNIVYRERLEVARAAMLEGKGFSQPLIDTEFFPGAAKQMFKVGEETGTLDEQLKWPAIYFDRELDSRIKKFTTMFEPLMIVFVGIDRRLRGHRARVGNVRRAQWRQGRGLTRSPGQRAMTRSTKCCPTKTATTVPKARNGPNGTSLRRPARFPAITRRRRWRRQ